MLAVFHKPKRQAFDMLNHPVRTLAAIAKSAVAGDTMELLHYIDTKNYRALGQNMGYRAGKLAQIALARAAIKKCGELSNKKGGERSLLKNESGSDTNWFKPDGSINYPPNNGAVPGTEVNMTLKPGDTLGRYGNIGEKSNFVTQTGADASKLALPPNTDPTIYQEFEVIREIPETIQAEIAPWGGSAGGGLQYELPMPILQLIKEGYIVLK